MSGIVEALALCMSLSQAPTIGVHLGSQHYPARDYNNVNLGTYVVHENGCTYGSYMNSIRRPTAYVGYMIKGVGFKQLDLVVGVAGGYKYPMPMIVPSVRIPVTQHSAFRVAAIAAQSEGRPAAVFHLTYEFKF